MRFFGGDSDFRIPESVDRPTAPLDLLYWSIFACLKSHARDTDPDTELEMGMYIGNEILEIFVPVRCAEAVVKASKECYILRHVTWKFRVNIGDAEFNRLKGRV